MPQEYHEAAPLTTGQIAKLRTLLNTDSEGPAKPALA